MARFDDAFENVKSVPAHSDFHRFISEYKEITKLLNKTRLNTEVSEN